MKWSRIVAAILAAEALPIVALVLVVVVYGLIRGAGSPTPERFAPQAGKWVGPIGGFLATLLCARWVARRAPSPIAHGVAVGIGTAMLDFGLALSIGGGSPVEPLLFLSNGGRLLAGVLGGRLAARGSKDLTPPETPSA